MFYSDLKQKFGLNSGYEDFKQQKNEFLEYAVGTGKRLYGEDYQNLINLKSRRKADLCQKFKAAHFSRLLRSESDFYLTFHTKVEDFVHRNINGDISLEAFEQTYQDDQGFSQSLETEKDRQSFINAFWKTIGDYHDTDIFAGIIHMESLLYKFLNTKPELLSLESFKLYLDENNRPEYVEYIERKSGEKNAFMNKFEQIYGSHHDEDTWNRLSDRIDLFLSDNFGGDLSLRAFKDFLENDEQKNLLPYLMEREKDVSSQIGPPEPFKTIIDGILSPSRIKQEPTK